MRRFYLPRRAARWLSFAARRWPACSRRHRWWRNQRAKNNSKPLPTRRTPSKRPAIPTLPRARFRRSRPSSGTPNKISKACRRCPPPAVAQRARRRFLLVQAPPSWAWSWIATSPRRPSSAASYPAPPPRSSGSSRATGFGGSTTGESKRRVSSSTGSGRCSRATKSRFNSAGPSAAASCWVAVANPRRPRRMCRNQRPRPTLRRSNCKKMPLRLRSHPRAPSKMNG